MSQYASDRSLSAELQCVELNHHIRSLVSVMQLITEDHEVDDVDAFFLQVDLTFERLEKMTNAAGWEVSQFRAARYALCAFFDECLFLAGGTKVREQLQSQSLQARYSDDYLAGDGFFEKLKLARIDSNSNSAILEIYLLCLIQGFKGRYAQRRPDELRQLIEGLRQETGVGRSVDPMLSPDYLNTPPIGPVSQRKASVWLIAFVSIAIGAGAWWGCDELLGRQSQALIENIEQHWVN